AGAVQKTSDITSDLRQQDASTHETFPRPFSLVREKITAMEPGASNASAAAVHLVVLGGFLGAGKTTTILKLAQHWLGAGKRVGIITNDQAAGLVDSGIFRSAGLDALEVAGGCFCCRFDDFIARTRELGAHGLPDVILA